jgi:transcription elongation factor GreA
LPSSDTTLLTKQGRELLLKKVSEKKHHAENVLRPMLADPGRDERDVAEFGRELEEIAALEAILDTSRLIDPKSFKEQVILGCRVTVQEVGGRKKETVRVVDPAEAFLDDERVAFDSPLGQALMGAKEGDRVTIHAPSGDWDARIKEVEAPN